MRPLYCRVSTDIMHSSFAHEVLQKAHERFPAVATAALAAEAGSDRKKRAHSSSSDDSDSSAKAKRHKSSKKHSKKAKKKSGKKDSKGKKKKKLSKSDMERDTERPGPVQLSAFLNGDLSSSDSDDGAARSAVSGKKIKLQLDRTKEDKALEAQRASRLAILNMNGDDSKIEWGGKEKKVVSVRPTPPAVDPRTSRLRAVVRISQRRSCPSGVTVRQAIEREFQKRMCEAKDDPVKLKQYIKEGKMNRRKKSLERQEASGMLQLEPGRVLQYSQYPAGTCAGRAPPQSRIGWRGSHQVRSGTTARSPPSSGTRSSEGGAGYGAAIRSAWRRCAQSAIGTPCRSTALCKARAFIHHNVEAWAYYCSDCQDRLLKWTASGQCRDQRRLKLRAATGPL